MAWQEPGVLASSRWGSTSHGFGASTLPRACLARWVCTTSALGPDLAAHPYRRSASRLEICVRGCWRPAFDLRVRDTPEVGFSSPVSSLFRTSRSGRLSYVLSGREPARRPSPRPARACTSYPGWLIALSIVARHPRANPGCLLPPHTEEGIRRRPARCLLPGWQVAGPGRVMKPFVSISTAGRGDVSSVSGRPGRAPGRSIRD